MNGRRHLYDRGCNTTELSLLIRGSLVNPIFQPYLLKRASSALQVGEISLRSPTSGGRAQRGTLGIEPVLWCTLVELNVLMGNGEFCGGIMCYCG